MKKKFMDFNPFFNKLINLNNKIEFIFLNYKYIKFANSLSYEDTFISYVMISKKIYFKNFLLNTGKLFLKSLYLLYKLKIKYNINIINYFPNFLLINKYIKKYGLYSFYNNIILRKICCNLRKLEPLNKILLGSDLWITGQRKIHSINRNFLLENDFDFNKNLIKCNIIYNWSYKDLFYFIEKFNIIINNIFNKGYLSLGCEPCSRIINFDENFRDGRWWWEKNYKKECGIHY